MKSIIAIVALAFGLAVFAQEPARQKSTGLADAKYKKASGDAWARYVAELAKAQDEYVKDLLIAHGEAVKRKDLDEAQRILTAVKEIQDDMKAMKAAPVGNPLAKGSVWRGNNTLDGRDYPASLTITSRNGEQFTAILEWDHQATGHAVVLVEGKTAEDDFAFEIKKIQKGNGVLLATYTGKLAGKTVTGKWTSLDNRVKGEFNLKQQR